MCGICGIYDPSGVQEESVEPMLEVLAHRGPDDRGVYSEGCIGLGSCRLSIIDLEGGRQPISNEDSRIWLVFNGEIYNFRELRDELEQKGHIFRTRTDTEVIVHLYEEVGEQLVQRLRGMFAFALWDVERKKLLLARDHLGQKPLFYAQEGEKLLFASEIKGILAASSRPREIDFTSLHHYLSLRFVPPPGTMLKNIQKLPAAHLLIHQQGRISLTRYWDISFEHKLNYSREGQYLELLREKLQNVISLHMSSDVPVGALLSGGLDSSMVVSIMSRDLEASFKTFSIGVGEEKFNELPFARKVADHHNTEHIEAHATPDLIAGLPKMIWHMDEPSDPIAACQYQAAALASKHVKVVLGGDGGDELFAGFDRYLATGYLQYYRLIPLPIRAHLIGGLLEQLPEGFGYKGLLQKLRWVHQLSALSSVADRYAGATCFFRFSHQQKNELFSQELWRDLRVLNSADVIADEFNRAPATDPVERMIYADYKTRLPEHSLMLTDRMSMAHSLELRSPFLDHELVSLLASFPARLKIRGHQLKYVLRRLGREYLPPGIVARRKQGFMLPVAHWLGGELYPVLEDYLLQSHFTKEGLFRRDTVTRMMTEHRQRRIDHHVRLWMLLNLAVWHDLYILRKNRSELAQELMGCRLAELNSTTTQPQPRLKPPR